MLNLEDFMNIRDLKQQGWSVSAIADELSLDRKTVRRHLLDAPQPYKRENPAPCKIDPYRPFLREYAIRRGWTIALQVKEVGSGASQRQLREKLLEAARRRELDVVVVALGSV